MSEGASKGRARRWRRRDAWIAVALVAIVAVVVAARTLPTWLARHLVASTLADLRLVGEGLDTLEVEVLEAKASVGPLRVGRVGVEPFELELLRVDLALGPLLDGRLAVESLVARGVELHLQTDEAGRTLIDGQPVAVGIRDGSLQEALREFRGGPGLSVDGLEVLDSRLVYESAAGRRLEIDLDRLGLDDLRSGQPERAARLELAGRANGIDFEGSGEISPFADEPALALDLVVEEIDAPGIESLTGPWKLARREGSGRFHGTVRGRILDGGAVALDVTGVLALTGLDLAYESGTSAAAKHLAAEVDLDYRTGSRPGRRLTGRVGLDADGLALAAGEQARLSFRSARGSLDDIEVGKAPDGGADVRWSSTVDAAEGRFAGRVRISVGLLVNFVRALRFLAAGTGPRDGSTGLEVWADREVSTPRSEVEIARLTVRDRRLEYHGGAGSFELVLDAEAEATGVKARSRRQRTDLEVLELSLDGLRFASGAGEVTLDGDVSTRAAGVAGVRARGRATIETVDASLERVALRSRDGTITGTLAGQASLAGLRSEVSERGSLPPVVLRIGTAAAGLGEARVEARPEAARWALRGSTRLERTELDVGRGMMATASIDRAEIRDVEVDETLGIRAGAAVLNDTELAATRSFLGVALSGDLGAMPGVDGGGEVSETPSPVIVEDAQWLLEELGYRPGPIDGLVGAGTVAAIEAYQRASGLAVDGRVTPELIAALEAATQPDAPADADTRKPTLTLDSLTAVDGARVHFSDDTVHPDVDTVLVFDTLTVTGLDTADADRYAEIRASAVANEFGRVDLEGSLTPFKHPPELDLRGRVANLELSPYSPYVAALTGVVVEEGVLGSEVTARVHAGAIDGQVVLDVRRLQVQTPSGKDAQQIADAIGVPVDTAVSLLEDSEGRIVLTIPVSGTLDEPEVDVSDAVGRAVGGALAAIFPPNVIAAMFEGGGDDVAFEPVVYAPGTDDLDAAARAYLDRLAALMGQHPGVVITLCGRAVAADADAIAAMLSDRLGTRVPARGEDGRTPDLRVASRAGALAVDRARSAKRYLLAERGVEPETVTECRSTFDAGDAGPPRVEIAL